MYIKYNTLSFILVQHNFTCGNFYYKSLTINTTCEVLPTSSLLTNSNSKENKFGVDRLYPKKSVRTALKIKA